MLLVGTHSTMLRPGVSCTPLETAERGQKQRGLFSSLHKDCLELAEEFCHRTPIVDAADGASKKFCHREDRQILQLLLRWQRDRIGHDELLDRHRAQTLAGWP